MADGTARPRAGPLGEDEMRAAAERVAERLGGDRDAVTVRSVRAEAGSGSLDTIARFLRGWRRAAAASPLVPRADLLPEDRDRLVGVAEEKLGVLVARERRLREHERTEHERTLRDTEQEVERLTLQLGEAGEEADRLAEALRVAQEENRTLTAQAADLVREREAARRELAATKEALAATGDERRSARDAAAAAAKAAARAEGERDQMGRDLAATQAAARHLEERLAEAVGLRDGLRGEADDLRRRLSEAAKDARLALAARTAAEDEARRAREAAARAEGEAASLRRTVERLAAALRSGPDEGRKRRVSVRAS